VKLIFRPVTKDDYSFLYYLLEGRPEEESISHKSMPSFIEHAKFLDSNPYKFHFVIYDNYNPIGVLYISHKNEVGIHFIKDIEGKEREESFEALVDFILRTKEKLFFNVSPKHKLLNKILKNKGLLTIQHTYENIH
jgi:hypothetical protein